MMVGALCFARDAEEAGGHIIGKKHVLDTVESGPRALSGMLRRPGA